jgi:hypothetical protein
MKLHIIDLNIFYAIQYNVYSRFCIADSFYLKFESAMQEYNTIQNSQCFL